MLMLILISNSSLIILFVSPVFSNLDFNFNYFVLSMALSLLNAFYLREREICFEEKEKKNSKGIDKLFITAALCLLVQNKW